MGNTPNPSNYQTAQNFKIDINQVYSDFIKEIDANRSIVNVNIQIDQNTLNSFDIKTIVGISQSLKVEDTPQESRAHCFYRLIGFPVVNSDKSNYYNPGLDIVPFPVQKELTLEKKIEIANNPLPGFKKFSAAREQYTNDIKRVWGQRPCTITASALALSSGATVRPFAAPVKNDDPFSFEKGDQSYTVDFKSIIGSNDKVLLTDYVDTSGDKPDPKFMFQTRSHFIKPFIVDPRIDFSCSPASRRVAVPFALNKNNLLVGENTFVKRPLIEKVIRERFAIQNQNDLSSSQSSLKDIILTIPTVTDQTLIDKMTNDIKGLSDRSQFQKYLFIIAAMCKELVRSQIIIKTIQSRYYWVPLPSINGPEGGSAVNGIIISNSLPSGANNNFVTDTDKAIIKATLNQAANQFNAQLSTSEQTQDPGNFAFDAFSLTFSNDTSESMGDLVKGQLDALNKKRNSDLNLANNALKTVEIIMGEFSGLGLCDIVAVMGALYTMPKDDLIGFLDTDAYNRMIALPEFSVLTKSTIQKAQTSFLAKVKDFYNLMDDIYKQLSKNNGLNR